MKPILQPGTHPDADTLAAFAEHLLATDEREQVVAHMAVCSRCREVAFLAQQAAEAEPMATPSLVSAREDTARSWWLSGWRWAWIPAGALAVLIGAATLLHLHHVETETQMARNAAPAEPEQQVATQQVAPKPKETSSQAVIAAPPRDAARPKPDSMHPALSAGKAGQEKASDALKAAVNQPAMQKQFALGQAAPRISQTAGISGGSIHGAMTARAQNQSIGGPMANQLQQNAFQRQQNQQQNLPRQNAVTPQTLYQSAQNSSPKPADKGAIGTLTPAPTSQTTVSVSAETVVVEPVQTPPAPAPPLQLSQVPLTNKSPGFSSVAGAQLKKAKIALPGGAQALSVASAAGRTIAIDTAGALFLSEDNGGHWQSVATQWTGRAVLVRNMSMEKDQKDLDALQAKAALRFELVTDKLETWTSTDGKTWTIKPSPNQ